MTEQNQDTKLQNQAPQPTSDKTSESTKTVAVSQKTANKDNSLTVEQRVAYLEAKQKKYGLTDPEKKELEDKKKQLDDKNSVDVKSSDDLQKTEPKDEDDLKKIFEEEDILKYLYDHWLLDGANWLFCKTYKGIGWTAEKTATCLYHAYKDSKSESDKDDKKYAEKNKLEKFGDDIDKRTQEISTNLENPDHPLNRVKAKLARFKSGQITEKDKESMLYGKLSQPNFRQMCDGFTDAIDKFQTARNLSALYTRALMMQNNMGKANPDTYNQEEYDKMVERNTLVILGAAYKSNSPNFFKDLEKNIVAANNTVNESRRDGKYKSNPKTHWYSSNSPYDNKALQKANAILGLDENGNLTQVAQQNAQNIPVSIREALDKLIKEDMDIRNNAEENKQKTAENSANSAGNQKRKSRAQERINIMVKSGIYHAGVMPSYFKQAPKNIDTSKIQYDISNLQKKGETSR